MDDAFTWYVVATAYRDSLESGYSNEVIVPALSASPPASATNVQVSWSETIMAGVTDNFNRTNASTLGANWTKASSATFSTCGISSNRANSQGGGSTDSICYWSADSFGNDHYSQAKIYPGAGDSCGVAVRINANGQYCLMGYQGTAVLQKIDSSGNYNQVGTGSFSYSDGDTIELSVSGTTFTCKKNGTTQFTETDSTYDSGSPGIIVYNAATVDDFGGGTVVSGILIPVAMYHYMNH